MNTEKKLNNIPEDYSPMERPEILNKVEQLADQKKYEVFKNIECRMDVVELSESLKFAGVTSHGNPGFANIGKFHDEFKASMLDRHAPYTEVGFSGNAVDSNWDYLFGCQIDSLDNLPDGLIGVDTGIVRFASITFRANSSYELVGGSEGPGDGMKTAGEYIKEYWLPKNMDKVNMADLNNMLFEIKDNNKTYYTGMIEIYKVELNDDPEMCFYIPLR